MDLVQTPAPRLTAGARHRRSLERLVEISQDPAPPPRRAEVTRLRRLALALLMALASINIWTGSPMLGLWVGSRVQILRGARQLDMLSVFVVVVVFAAASFALIRFLAYLEATYESSSGQPRSVRKHVPWLRSMRGEMPVHGSEKPRVTLLDRILVSMAVLAVVAFEVWFFLLAESPFPTWVPNSS